MIFGTEPPFYIRDPSGIHFHDRLDSSMAKRIVVVNAAEPLAIVEPTAVGVEGRPPSP